jgi:hypothetical protein
MIHNKRITSLDISWNGFGDMDPLAVICDLLRVNTTLTSLDLSSNRVRAGGCTASGFMLLRTRCGSILLLHSIQAQCALSRTK